MNLGEFNEELVKSFGFRASVPKKANVVARYSRSYCLDVGCSDGNYLPYFKCKKVVGVDISLFQLDRARLRNTNVDLVLADALKLPFKSDLFHFVWCSSLIGHLKETEGRKLLKELERVCCNGGDIIITTQNFSMLYKLIFKTLGRASTQLNPWYITFYDMEMLKKLGFCIIDLSIASEWSITHTWLRNKFLRVAGDLGTKIFNFIGCVIIAHKRVKKTRARKGIRS